MPLPNLGLFCYTYAMQELILVVDDEPKVARLAHDYLEKNGFRVLVAGDGPTALTWRAASDLH